MLVKSGTDCKFSPALIGVVLMLTMLEVRDLSDLTLTLTANPPGSIRRYVISSMIGRRLEVTPNTPTSTGVQSLIDRLLDGVTAALDKVCPLGPHSPFARAHLGIGSRLV